TVLASNFSLAAAKAVLAASASEPSTSMSNTLPCRTEVIPATPSEYKAPSIALPCGSSTPVFRVTVTRAFMRVFFLRTIGALAKKRERCSLDQLGAAGMWLLIFLHDAEPAGDFGIGLHQAAHIAAKT